jgi:hypothetical protein
VRSATTRARTRNGLEVGFAALVLVYLGLAVAVAWLLRRLTRRPPETEVAPRARAADEAVA